MRKNLINAASSLLEDFEHRLGDLKKKIEEQIRSAPDNPRIKRLGSRSFTMSFSEIKTSDDLILSPFYYDFKSQYEKIIEILNATTMERCSAVLREILTNRNRSKTAPLYTYLYQGHNIKFHPEVVENVRKALTC
jgi:hypothetical protein